MHSNPHAFGATLFTHCARFASGFTHWNVELGFPVEFSREKGGNW